MPSDSVIDIPQSCTKSPMWLMFYCWTCWGYCQCCCESMWLTISYLTGALGWCCCYNEVSQRWKWFHFDKMLDTGCTGSCHYDNLVIWYQIIWMIAIISCKIILLWHSRAISACISNSIHWNPGLSWCQLCCHRWHWKLWLWQPQVPPVMTKLE